MVGQKARARWSLTGLGRRLRHGDEASASMVTFIVGTSAFLISSAVLIHFIAEPPGGTAGLEHAELKNKASNALAVLLGTQGYPATWADSATDVDEVQRLGLIEAGSSIRIDPVKFGALSNGSYASPSATNGYVDYDEARAALGLTGYDFHLRAYPIFEPFDLGSYGVEGMEDFRVAYIGDWSGVTEEDSSKSERYNLDALPVGFSNVTRATLIGVGDAYRDDTFDLRDYLVPQLGSSPLQTIISSGSGTPKYDFKIAASSVYSTEVPLTATPSNALILSSDGTDYGYTKSRELRSVVGLANMSSLTASGTLAWSEFVNTGTVGNKDDDDYGYVELSPDNGTTWYALTNSAALRSQDTPTLPHISGFASRAVTVSAANCAACLGKNEVWIGYHWVADNDNKLGSGWFVDDISITVGATSVFQANFESPAYDMLIIGSSVDQNVMTSAEVKYAIRDYVEIYGGRILVLGGETNVNWLQPLFHVGIREASPGVASPDATHPLLTIPNELDWESYDYGNTAWEFTGNDAEDLFNMVVGVDSTEHILSVSSTGSFGSSNSDGVVMLTTYLPHTMSPEEARKFMANALTYGRYHRLYMEVGPSVPEVDIVASAARAGTMDKTTDTSTSYVDIAFILYVWPGGTGTSSSLASDIKPSQPQTLAVTQSGNNAALTWTAPASAGTGSLTNYHIYRGGISGTETYLASTLGTNTSFLDATVTLGSTYYYNVTAESSVGQSASSNHDVVTLATTPGVPQAFTTSMLAGSTLLDWDAPSSNGGATITHYNVYRSSDNVTFAILTNTSNTDHQDIITNGTTYYYKITAVNTQGEGTATSAKSGTAGGPPSAPLALIATPVIGKQVNLVWTAPVSDGGFAITGYEIWRGTTSGGETLLTTTGTSTTYSDTGLTAGVTYYYKVKALNTQGASSFSSEASALALI